MNVTKKIKKIGLNYLKSRPLKIKKFFKNYGHLRIYNFRVCRTPIIKTIEKILNLLSKDKFKHVKNKYHYDSIFHLYLIITFENGMRFSIEKNEVVIIQQDPPIRQHTECIETKVNITLKRLIETSEFINPNLYRYTPWEFNCQNFILSLCIVAGVDHKTKTFILQDFKEAFNDEYLKKISVSLTDFYGIIKRLFGAGL